MKDKINLGKNHVLSEKKIHLLPISKIREDKKCYPSFYQKKIQYIAAIVTVVF